MNRADRKRWASARTLADVGELTAQWLEGEISERPGYCGPPDDETASLIPALAACNRAGYVTDGSQPGGSGWYEGTHWEQRAAVEGFADVETWVRLQDACERLPVMILARQAPRWRCRYRTAIPVTRSGGWPCTRFGTTLSRRYLADDWAGYGECSAEAVDAICDAWQITLIDTEWGRRDSPLWAALAAFAGLAVTA